MRRPADSSLPATRYEEIIRRALFPPFLATFALAALFLWQITALLAAAREVDQVDDTIAQADQTIRLMVDVETGERGYLVGGNPEFLLPYTQGRVAIRPALTDLARRVARNPDQLRRVVALRGTFDRWQENAEYEIRLRDRPGGHDAFVAYFNQARGKALMDAMRDQLAAFTREEEALRERRADSVQRQTLLTLGFGGPVTLLAGGLLGFGARRQMRHLSTRYEEVLHAELEAREYLGATLTSIGDAVLVTDAAGRVTRMNPVAEQLTGWPEAEAQGKDSRTVFDILNETTRREVESPVARVLRDGVVVGLANHTLLRRRDGTEIPIDDSGAPIRDALGTLRGVVLVFRDISERREQEDIIAAAAARQTRIAETLQQSLLLTPPPDALAGAQVATLYAAAQDEAELGGDFYDAFPVSEGILAFVLGDVTGKGLEAARFTAEVKFALRALLREHGSPALALTRLNQFLLNAERLEARSRSVLVSIAVVVLDTATGELACSLGGAESALIVRQATSGTEEIGANGPLLGADLGPETPVEYQEARTQLGTADLLVLVTDGVTEARRGNDFFGIDGVARVTGSAVLTDREWGETPLPSLAEAVLGAARDFAGGTLRDDACILVARRSA